MSPTPFLTPPIQQSIDSLPVAQTSLEALDLARVQAHIEQASARGRYHGGGDPLAYLLEKRCVVTVGEQRYPTLAGILCFGANPQATFPLASVDLGHYYGTATLAHEMVHIEKQIGGTIFQQIERLEQYLWQNTHHGMTIDEQSFQRVEVHEYPRAVLRELSVNMLAHRDYSMFWSACRVQLFRNRIEWINPGTLPEGVSIPSLLSAQVSRNPIVLAILYEAGYVEAFGQGLDTVIAVLQREGMRLPSFEEAGSFFQVTVYGQQQEAANPDQPPPISLSEGQSRILLLLREQRDLSMQQIHERLGDRAERTVQHDLKALVEAGLVERMGEARAARYRLRRR